MSKYIIDIPDGVEWGVVTCRTEDGFYTRDFDSLEELNSDYINEHFGDLQDDAYNKGYAQCQDDYGDALKHAKDTAYKKGFEDGKAVNDKGCEGCMYQDNTIEHHPCGVCRNAYNNMWTAKDDKIKAGDIVKRYLNGKLDSTGIYLGEDGDYWNCWFWTGAVFGTFAYPKNQFKKTGRHVDIDKILEEMRND